MANNSSGMCCGVSQNTYHTLKDMRVVFADGTVLDTADPVSCESFMRVRQGSGDKGREGWVGRWAYNLLWDPAWGGT